MDANIDWQPFSDGEQNYFIDYKKHKRIKRVKLMKYLELMTEHKPQIKTKDVTDRFAVIFDG